MESDQANRDVCLESLDWADILAPAPVSGRVVSDTHLLRGVRSKSFTLTKALFGNMASWRLRIALDGSGSGTIGSMRKESGLAPEHLQAWLYSVPTPLYLAKSTMLTVLTLETVNSSDVPLYENMYAP